MDPSQLLTLIGQYIPDKYAHYVPLCLLALSGTCNLLAIGLLPPKPGTRLYSLRKAYYVAVTWGALNLGKAANRIQCGRTGLMVPYEEKEKAHDILKNAGVSVLEANNTPSRASSLIRGFGL